MSARKARKGKASRTRTPKASKAPKAETTPPHPEEPSEESPEESPEEPLSDREQAFVAAYFRNGFNAASAWRETQHQAATTTVASSAGWRMRHRPRVAAEIERRLEASKLQASEVVALLEEQARGNLGRYVEADGEGYRFNFEALREDGAERLVKKVKFGQGGTVSFEFYDAQAALDKLARVHGLYQDRLDVSGGVRIDELAGLAQAVKARLGAPPEGADG